MSELTVFDAIFSTPEGEKLYYEAGILVEVCEKLHELMEEQGFKNKDIAKKLGVSDSQVSQWLAGKASMQLKTVANILFAMGLKFTGFEAEGIARYENITANDIANDATSKCKWPEKETEIVSQNVREIISGVDTLHMAA